MARVGQTEQVMLSMVWMTLMGKFSNSIFEILTLDGFDFTQINKRWGIFWKWLFSLLEKTPLKRNLKFKTHFLHGSSLLRLKKFKNLEKIWNCGILSGQIISIIKIKIDELWFWKVIFRKYNLRITVWQMGKCFIGGSGLEMIID